MAALQPVRRQARNLDSLCLRKSLYRLAFLQNDSAGMVEQVTWSADKSELDDEMLGFEADTAAYSGQLAKTREIALRTVASAEMAKEKQMVARHEASMALTEALFGNAAEARRHAASALGRSKDRDVQYPAALALALASDPAAQGLADDLGNRFPEDTIVQFNYLPTLHAHLALSRHDAARAVEILQAAARYELGDVGVGCLYPVYVRGEAYLAGHRGNEAAVEFQKILDHRGVVVNGPDRRTRASPNRSSLRLAGRHRQSPSRVSGFPHAVERCGRRYPRAHRCESGVRQAEISNLLNLNGGTNHSVPQPT